MVERLNRVNNFRVLGKVRWSKGINFQILKIVCINVITYAKLIERQLHTNLVRVQLIRSNLVINDSW